MKASLEALSKALPAEKQRELARVQEIIIKCFEACEKEFIRLEMIVLFGSYATGKWVEDSYVQEGTRYEYKSDLDIFVATEQMISDDNWLSLGIDNYVFNDPLIETEVNIIHHDIYFFNKKVKENYYFFKDIAEEGVVLYDSGRHEVARPGPMTPAEQGKKVEEEFEYWFEKANEFFKVFRYCLKEQHYNKAAFELHQTTESYYTTLLLVYVDYKPKWHNLKKLGKQVASIDPRLREVFPQRDKEEQRLFQLLKRAYVDARYKKDYVITAEELVYLSGRIEVLRELTEELCVREIARLKGSS